MLGAERRAKGRVEWSIITLRRSSRISVRVSVAEPPQMNAGAPKDAAAEVEVSNQDQKDIAEFANLADQLKQLRAELKAWTDEIDILDEIAGEVMLSDDLRALSGEGLRYRVADVFLELEPEEHDVLVDEDVAAAKAKRSALLSRAAGLEARQGELKRALYTRFGSQIALETDE